MAAKRDMWVFGYGSLMWDPGFAHEEMQPALLYGYHRAFCIMSHRHRGTPENPGLVLGLIPGGSCVGRAFRVAASKVPETLEYLHEREMPQYVYEPRDVPVHVPAGRVTAHTYVADIAHERCLRNLTLEETAGYIRRGVGGRGPNTEYLENTIAHLDELGIKEGRLHELLDIVHDGVG